MIQGACNVGACNVGACNVGACNVGACNAPLLRFQRWHGNVGIMTNSYKRLLARISWFFCHSFLANCPAYGGFSNFAHDKYLLATAVDWFGCILRF